MTAILKRTIGRVQANTYVEIIRFSHLSSELQTQMLALSWAYDTDQFFNDYYIVYLPAGAVGEKEAFFPIHYLDLEIPKAIGWRANV